MKFRSTCHACERIITGPVMVCIINRLFRRYFVNVLHDRLEYDLWIFLANFILRASILYVIILNYFRSCPTLNIKPSFNLAFANFAKFESSR